MKIENEKLKMKNWVSARQSEVPGCHKQMNDSVNPATACYLPKRKPQRVFGIDQSQLYEHAFV
jgi:hypothetical protein